MKMLATFVAVAALATAVPAAAQEQRPLKPGDYVDVTAITIDPGHGDDYAKFLAGEWRKNQDFAVQQGWISGYEILYNPYKRKGEPDLYLVTKFATMADNAEMDRRRQMYMQHSAMTMAEMQAQSRERDQYRHVESEMLLRELVWNDAAGH